MKTIVIANSKGGSGKTTTAVNLATLLAEKGYKTLLVDLDPRQDAVRSTQQHKLPNLVVETELDFIKPLFDFAIIDTPAGLDSVLASALEEADAAILTVDIGLFSLKGAERTLHFIGETLQEEDKIPVWALATQYRQRTRYGKECLEELRRFFGDHFFNAIIHTTVKVQEAQSLGVPLGSYDKESRGYKDYQAFVEEFLNAFAQKPASRKKQQKGNVQALKKSEGVNLDDFDQMMQEL